MRPFLSLIPFYLHSHLNYTPVYACHHPGGSVLITCVDVAEQGKKGRWPTDTWKLLKTTFPDSSQQEVWPAPRSDVHGPASISAVTSPHLWQCKIMTVAMTIVFPRFLGASEIGMRPRHRLLVKHSLRKKYVNYVDLSAIFFPFLLVWLTWRTCVNTVALSKNTVNLNALRCADLKIAMFRMMKIHSIVIISIFNCWLTSRVPDLSPLFQVSLS